MLDRTDAELRSLIVGVLYHNRKHHHVAIRPTLFDPPISKNDIFRTCIELRDVGLINGHPSNDGQGYVVMPTTLVSSLWEGHYSVPLDIDLPPDATSSPQNA